jgi:hypothetical protein
LVAGDIAHVDLIGLTPAWWKMLLRRRGRAASRQDATSLAWRWRPLGVRGGTELAPMAASE